MPSGRGTRRATNSGKHAFPNMRIPNAENTVKNKPVDWNKDFCRTIAPLESLLILQDGTLRPLWVKSAGNNNPKHGQVQRKKTKKDLGSKPKPTKAFVETITKGFDNHPDDLRIVFKHADNKQIDMIEFPRPDSTLDVKFIDGDQMIDISVEKDGKTESRWLFALHMDTPNQAHQCKEVWSHLRRSFRTMSPKKVRYLNVERPQPDNENAARSNLTGHNPPLHIVIQGIGTMTLTDAVASPDFQRRLCEVADRPFPGCDPAVAAAFLKDKDDGLGTELVPQESSAQHKSKRIQARGQYKKRAKARQEHETNPEACEMKRSRRLARKPSIDYSELAMARGNSRH